MPIVLKCLPPSDLWINLYISTVVVFPPNDDDDHPHLHMYICIHTSTCSPNTTFIPIMMAALDTSVYACCIYRYDGLHACMHMILASLCCLYMYACWLFPIAHPDVRSNNLHMHMPFHSLILTWVHGFCLCLLPESAYDCYSLLLIFLWAPLIRSILIYIWICSFSCCMLGVHMYTSTYPCLFHPYA